MACLWTPGRLLWASLAGQAPPAGCTHPLALRAFSGAPGGREGEHQGGSPRSRVAGCFGGLAGHCPGSRAAPMLPAGEPGPEVGRGSGRARPGAHGDRDGTCETCGCLLPAWVVTFLSGTTAPLPECSPAPLLCFSFQGSLPGPRARAGPQRTCPGSWHFLWSGHHWAWRSVVV